MSNNILQNEETRPEMDGLLHEFFESEMPKPWPAFKAPMQQRVAKPARTQYTGRLALAACVALMVAGYLTLGGFFSRPTTLEGVQQKANEIGQRQKAEKR
jgi:hypothetical protein